MSNVNNTISITHVQNYFNVDKYEFTIFDTNTLSNHQSYFLITQISHFEQAARISFMPLYLLTSYVNISYILPF